MWEKYGRWKGSIDGVFTRFGCSRDVTEVNEESKYLIARTLLKLPKMFEGGF